MNFSRIPQTSPIGKFARFLLRFLPPNAVLPILQGPLRGKRWIAGSGVHGYWLGSFETDKMRLLQKTIQPNAVVFDIGAHVGYYTLLASQSVGEHGRVIAFEPVPQNISYLQKHMQLNDCQNTQIIEAAVSDRDGKATFVMGNSSSEGRLADDGNIFVKTVCIDSLIEAGQIPPPNLCKIDIEGGEYEALLGARQTITLYQPIIFVALHTEKARQNCFRLLQEYGYTFSGADGHETATAHEILAQPSR
jgi:FkbM family methyltransferase